MSLNELADRIHAVAVAKGFYAHESSEVRDDAGKLLARVENRSLPSEKLLLIVSEVIEAQDALRDSNWVLEAEEVADILIRTLDYAAWRGLDMDGVVAWKMAKNAERPRLHGRVF